MLRLLILCIIQLPFYSSINAMQQSPVGCECVDKVHNSWQGSSRHICNVQQTVSQPGHEMIIKSINCLKINEPVGNYIEYDHAVKKHTLLRQWEGYVPGQLPANLLQKKNTLRVLVHAQK